VPSLPPRLLNAIITLPRLSAISLLLPSLASLMGIHTYAIGSAPCHTPIRYWFDCPHIYVIYCDSATFAIAFTLPYDFTIAPCCSLPLPRVYLRCPLCLYRCWLGLATYHCRTFLPTLCLVAVDVVTLRYIVLFRCYIPTPHLTCLTWPVYSLLLYAFVRHCLTLPCLVLNWSCSDLVLILLPSYHLPDLYIPFIIVVRFRCYLRCYFALPLLAWRDPQRCAFTTPIYALFTLYPSDCVQRYGTRLCCYICTALRLRHCSCQFTCARYLPVDYTVVVVPLLDGWFVPLRPCCSCVTVAFVERYACCLLPDYVCYRSFVAVTIPGRVIV